MNNALQNAEKLTENVISGGDQSRGFGFGSFGFGSSSSGGLDFVGLLSQLPSEDGRSMASQARDLKAQSEQKERENQFIASRDNANQVPGMSPEFDPVETVRKIYPILEFRDRVVKKISNIISKIPGLEKLLEKISENLTAFILGLLAPFVRPIIEQVSKTLKDGSSTVIGASAKSQFVVWEDHYSSNPTHSMLSKDHFTNVLNGCAGEVATEIVKYVVPRVLYAMEHTRTPVDEVVDDILRVFHHPALRDDDIEIHRIMYKTVRNWARDYPRRNKLNYLLSSESVKDGKNHLLKGEKVGHGHSHGGGSVSGIANAVQNLGHGKVAGSLWSQVNTRSLDFEVAPSAEPSIPEKRDFHQNPNYWEEAAPSAPEIAYPPHPIPGTSHSERLSLNWQDRYLTSNCPPSQPTYASQPSAGGYYQGPPPRGPPGGYPGYGQPPAPPPGSYDGPKYSDTDSYGAPRPQYTSPPPPPPPGAPYYGGSGSYGNPPYPSDPPYPS